MAWIRCSGNMGGRTELKTATGSVAVFNTNLPAPVIDAKSDIGYSAKGYRSAAIINTSNTPTTNKTPYLFRPSYSNGYGYETLIGGTCGVNQLVDTGDTSVNTISGHKYLTRINHVESIIAGGSAVSINDSSEDNVIDLTAYFGTNIAGYVYTLESGTSGAGVAWLKNNGFFGADYYPYNAGGLLSVKTSKKINRDSNNVIVGEYPLDDIELRGILKLDGNNNLYYDGDTYESNGSVTRKYGIVTLNGTEGIYWQSLPTADENLTAFYISVSSWESIFGSYPKRVASSELLNGISDKLEIKPQVFYTLINSEGIYGWTDNSVALLIVPPSSVVDLNTWLGSNNLSIVYELATPTTETADTFTNPMQVDGNGTEEFVDGRAVQMPVGHSTIYGEDMKARFTDFGVTVYGGSIDFTSGTLISDKNADGTAKTPETISVTPVALETRKGSNNICSNTNGNSTIKYVDYGT